MGKPLTVLVITNDHPTAKVKREKQQTEAFVREVMPVGTKIEYATYGSRVQEGERGAELKVYEIVIMPGSLAEHFGTSASIYAEEVKAYRPRSNVKPFTSVPTRMKYDPAKRKLP